MFLWLVVDRPGARPGEVTSLATGLARANSPSHGKCDDLTVESEVPLLGELDLAVESEVPLLGELDLAQIWWDQALRSTSPSLHLGKVELALAMTSPLLTLPKFGKVVALARLVAGKITLPALAPCLADQGKKESKKKNKKWKKYKKIKKSKFLFKKIKNCQ